MFARSADELTRPHGSVPRKAPRLAIRSMPRNLLQRVQPPPLIPCRLNLPQGNGLLEGDYRVPGFAQGFHLRKTADPYDGENIEPVAGEIRK